MKILEEARMGKPGVVNFETAKNFFFMIGISGRRGLSNRIDLSLLLDWFVYS